MLVAAESRLETSRGGLAEQEADTGAGARSAPNVELSSVIPSFRTAALPYLEIFSTNKMASGISFLFRLLVTSLLTLFFFAHRSAGELNPDELERIVTIMQNPAQFKIPTWFLNRRKDMTDGKNLHVVSNIVDQKLRDDLERLKKIRSHRGLRHAWNLRVRGQHTCTTGRRSGKTVAAKKK